MSLVTVFSAFNPMDARLEAAQFHAVVTHELSALSMDGYALAAGGILVQVPAEEAAEAKEFLAADTPPDEPEKD
jgi:hypothetical protein